MKERKRKPAPLPAPEPPSDPRLRNLLPQLESLPEELRDALVSALEAVVRTHHLLQDYQGRTRGGKAREL
jgi:hypothetical protein